jgi:hypothetical protein
MSKKVDENYFHDDKEEREDEEDKKCPPQRVPSLNPNNEWAASHNPEERTSATRFKDDPREPRVKLHVDKKEAEIHNHEQDAVFREELRTPRRTTKDLTKT